MLDFMTVIKALTDENRVRILMALRDHEMCVCQVTAFLDLSPSTTSKHLSILRQARLIESRKKGKWVYYKLAEGPSVPSVVRDALALIVHGTEHAPAILEDQRRIRRILEQEATLYCSGNAPLDTDTYHSLEIHTLNDGETLADSETETQS